MVKASKPGIRQQKVTIRQVAEAAGVSIATVSRVLNGHADVSGATRQAVEHVLRERGYLMFAISLRRHRVNGRGLLRLERLALLPERSMNILATTPAVMPLIRQFTAE